MDTRLRISRRTILKSSVGLGAALAMPAIVSRANAQSQFDWQQFKGQRLDVLLPKTPRYELLKSAEGEFTALTGIEVSSELIPEQQQRQKMLIEFSSGRPTFDVTAIPLHALKRQAAKGNWLADLKPFLADPATTSPDFDFADFGKGSIEFSTNADGTMTTLPYLIDYWMLYYNKELFEQKGLAYPVTLDDMAAAAAALTDPGAGVYGFASRGQKAANVPVWTVLLLGQDIDAIDAAGTFHTESQEAIWAAEMYKKLNTEYAPPGTIGFNWNECQTSFLQGKLGMWLDAIGFAAPFEDPSKSQVVGKVGYGVTPKGPKAHHTGVFGEGIGVANASERKQLAWLYLQWATNKANQLTMFKSGSGAPARVSPFNDQETIAASPFGQQYFDCLTQSAAIGRPGLPQITAVTEFRDVFGVALTNMLAGGDPASELKTATEAFKPIYERTERT